MLFVFESVGFQTHIFLPEEASISVKLVNPISIVAAGFKVNFLCIPVELLCIKAFEPAVDVELTKDVNILISLFNVTVTAAEDIVKSFIGALFKSNVVDESNIEIEPLTVPLVLVSVPVPYLSVPDKVVVPE